jgi:isopenicillin N synthase-like dioxygenase
VPSGIPVIDVGALFGSDSAAQSNVDAAIARAARELGFLTLSNLPADLPLGHDARRALLRLFDLPSAAKRRLWRRNWAPENPNVYRGYFPLEAGVIKEGFDVGPDPIARRLGDHGGDALAETTPMPPDESLPGWRELVRRSFVALEQIGGTLMHALARGLGLPQDHFDEAFRAGNSTFRLMTYPPWPERASAHGWPIRPVTDATGERRYDIGGEHVDSGFVTLLQQDRVGGLQARVREDTWVDVPPLERTLVVNFGKLLERWTGGRIRATEHRVLGNDVDRNSIAFFYEPRIDARIAPLPIAGVETFAPFSYGDHVWESMSGFAEFANLQRWPGEGESRA